MAGTAGAVGTGDGGSDSAPPHVLFVRATMAASLHPWMDDFIDALAGACEVVLFDPAAPVREQFEGVPVVVDLGGFAPHELIDAGRDAGVELWQVLGYGLDHIDVDYVHASGMTLAHTPGACTEVALAEHVFHLMLTVTRQYRESRRVLASAQYGGPFSDELDGKTLGIIGFGASGRAVARRAVAFGMRVLALDAIPLAAGDPDSGACEYLGDLDSLDELLCASDFVSLHLPLTEETRHVLDSRAIAQMKSTAVVLNVARGALIDTAALVDALAAGALRGAGLDVFEDEPLPPDHPLVALEGVFVTPHVAGLTWETSQRRGRFAAANVLRVLSGDDPIEGLVT
jgi:phosphoglycerate dehydrogenase-like enzyme